MQIPIFNPQQYLSASYLNGSFQTIYSSISEYFNQFFTPGFINVPQVSYSYSNFSVTVTMNPGFALRTVSSLGVIDANTPSSVSQQTVNFQSFIPVTGTVNVYLLAKLSPTNINPITIVPPPPGDPSYSPELQAYTGYQNQRMDIVLFASTTPPDNQNTFALGFGEIAYDSTSIQLNTSSPLLSAFIPQLNVIPITQNEIITTPGAYIFASSGLIATLPQPSSVTGMIFAIVGPPSGTSQVSGNFVGLYSETGTASSMVIGPGESILLAAASDVWLVLGGSFAAANQISFPLPVSIGGTGSTNPSLLSGNGINVSGNFPNQTVSLQTPVSVANGGTGTSTPSMSATSPLSLSGSFPNYTVSMQTPLAISYGGTGTSSPSGLTAQAPLSVSGGFPNQSVSLQVPLPVSYGGTGSTNPSLQSGTGIQISGNFPSQTVSMQVPVSIANGGTGTSNPQGISASSPLNVSGSFPNQFISLTGVIPISNGGTGSSNAFAARVNLGTSNSESVSLSYGTTLDSSYCGKIVYAINSNQTFTLVPSYQANGTFLTFVSLASNVTLNITAGGGNFVGGGYITGRNSILLQGSQYVSLYADGANWDVVSISYGLSSETINPQTVSNSQTFGANQNGSLSVSIYSPCNGLVNVWGVRNVATPSLGTSYPVYLYINNSQVASENTQDSVFLMGSIFTDFGSTTTATISGTFPQLFTLRVMATFIPSVYLGP